MTKSLLKITDEIESGLHPSLAESKIPLWIDGLNVTPRDGGVSPVLGQFKLTNIISTNPVVGVKENVVAGVRSLFWGDATKLFLWQEGDTTATDVTRLAGAYTGDTTTRWVLHPYGEFMLATNFVDVPQVWDPASPANFVDLDSLGGSEYPSIGRAKIVIQSGPFVLLFRTDIGDEVFQWSDEDSLTVWTPVTGNFAGDLTIRDLLSNIEAAVDLAGGIGVYARDQLHLVSFIGAPLVFSQDHQLDGIGAVGPHSIVPVGRLNYGFGPRGIFRTDGLSSEYIDVPSIRDFIYGDLNRDRAFTTVGWNDANEQTVFWSYPKAGDDFPSSTVGFSYRTNTWWLFEFNRTAATNTGVFEGSVTATFDGELFSQGVLGQVPSLGAGIPLDLSAATFDAAVGYGAGGYGGLGYGGTISGVG